MKALVTGSAGFVGRHVAAELESRGWQVNRADPAHQRSSWSIDARRIFAGVNTLSCRVFDLVVHCAYHVGGRVGIDQEHRNLARNLELDAAMFEWACASQQRAVLYFSSSAVYPVRLQQHDAQEHGVTLLRENDVTLTPDPGHSGWVPDARYGWAKLTGEMVAAAAARDGLRVHVVRPFSGYGEDQDHREYPFPAIVRRAARGDLSVWGPEGQRRDWIHIDDVVAGALAVVEADERRPVNLCTGVATEFGGLARRVWELAEEQRQPARRIPPVQYELDRPTGVLCRVGDPARMQTYYQPRISLDDGIRRALAALRGTP